MRAGDYIHWMGIEVDEGFEHTMFSVEIWLDDGRVEGYVRNESMKCQPVSEVWLAMMFAEWQGRIRKAMSTEKRYWDVIEVELEYE